MVKEINPNHPLYSIGVVADLLQIHPRTLRVYEQEGLIRPARRGGKRYYSNSDLQWLKCLRKLLSEEGLNIAGVKKLLSMAPCWQIRNCDEETRKQCPAILNFPVPCWELKPRACVQKGLSCEACDVYTKKREDIMQARCCDGEA
ncbi:MerR family transcriptional regulator [Thermodesulforhabdus norvegica]|uniref:MerR family transcriptional regulator, heat shock protein HspR n=1 Tax=Thermodesulforhabdus norvegica TaxID=39841 RepID=A0A1I4UC67_9BACT|nr:MerR family transcriptional regulator [Thermodesulforhabdus norvegica]SFM86431.1 MerR family transcriptional regulator, heat shock protein HspR [Thermodesulforhabdus norvegica]